MADFGGRYRRVRRLGAGGMGEVWLAHDEELGDRPVAIKMMHSRMLADAEDVARFQQEMRLTSSMQHPNIMTVFTTGTDHGVPFMVMEYLEGSDLTKLPAGWGHDEIARAGREACLGLAYAHGRGIVHRDIKPSNLFACNTGLVKVTDFGVAKALTASKVTMPGTVAGTPGYMAPEQLLGQPATVAIDVWATGCTLYKLLSGRLPLQFASLVEYMAAAFRGERPAPLGVAPDVPAWLATAVMSMLEPDPRSRPTAAECVTLLSGPPASPAPVAPVPVASAPAAPAPVMPVPQPPATPAPRPGQRSRPSQSPPLGSPPPALRQQPIRQARSKRAPASSAGSAPAGTVPIGAVPAGRFDPMNSGSPAPARPASSIPARSVPVRRRGKLLAWLAGSVVVLVAAGAVTAWFFTRPIWIPGPGTAYVTNSNGIVPVNLTTGQVGNPIAVNGSTGAMVLSPQGTTAYVVDEAGSGYSLVPVSLATGSVGKVTSIVASTVGGATQVILSPDGKTAYVASDAGIVPVNVATGTKGTAIRVGSEESAIAISPDGTTLYVTTDGDQELVAVDLSTGAVSSPMDIGVPIFAIAAAPGGAGVYVYESGGFALVIPATGHVSWRVSSAELGTGGATGGSLVVAPGGQMAYAGGAGTGVVPVNLRTHQVGPLIRVNDVVASLAMSPDGKDVYVAGLSGAVYPINVLTSQVGKAASAWNSSDAPEVYGESADSASGVGAIAVSNR